MWQLKVLLFAGTGRAAMSQRQGMADKLGGGPDNQPPRLRLFGAAGAGLEFEAAPLEGRGHCPHHEAPAAVAAAVRPWIAKLA